MSNRNLLIAVAAVAALICLCTADVSHINHKPPQDVLVPFNDLLPPPLEEPSTTEATTAATTTTPATKPTKKSYYQQLAKSKDAHHIEEKASAKSQPAIQLALDLLPPFAEAPEQPQIKDVHTTTHQPLVSSRPTPTATTKKSVPLVAKPQPIPQRQFVPQPQPQPQPQQQPHPQQLHARVSRPNSIAHSAAASSIVPVKSSISSDLITQYLTNFQFTTRRPSRGALPTLTPFPNHIKK